MTAKPTTPNPLTLEQMRQQFDAAPYPRIPPEATPEGKYNDLFVNNIVTPFYLRDRRVVDTQGTLILDAGCGTGYKALVLAIANPGAKIVGIDLSEKSIDLAKKRLEFHKFENVEFHAMSIYDIADLGLKFDYINCDEVLYLLPDPLGAFQALRRVLSPGGILRANLHSQLQRLVYYRAQEMFRMFGLMDEAPTEEHRQTVIATMKNLKVNVDLRARGWVSSCEQDNDDGREQIFANFLLSGDQGFTIPELFDMLEQSDLEFLSMLNWRQWDVQELFQNVDELPGMIGMALAMASPAEQLRLYELLNPVHRLFDFWCYSTDTPDPDRPVEEWSDEDWQTARVHLHPQLRSNDAKGELLKSLENQQPFDFAQLIDLPARSAIPVDGIVAATLLSLWDGPQPIQALVQRYKTLHPVHPVSLVPLTDAEAFQAVQNALTYLEPFLYVLLERQ
ncbi:MULTISPECIES: class I SAM-dependent methyltransferase [unclassified Leptolyngbya]|uniref:class I SAM-dependent methyltransferase n=1 Tax=unclassified Leptolyngbya TaxID=2650499 RepID=UPI00168835F5|nr:MULTISPECIES: class I SAM-dependent methyltransferase [unclassified Leptolyngbya]MBD1912032.1 class I SAM-dependent methyltransferase [Leptolyngbya sp. FACHB-8]MBD2155402.1 class I SAM-dependent methyltransferase [Leptolyngbya sp. FACHB-16]